MRSLIAGRKIACGLLLLVSGACLPPGAGARVAEPNRTERRTGVFPFHPYLARHEVWEFTSMDQGGRLVQMQLIGSERDEDIARAVRQPGFFAAWGDPIVWDALEKTALEKSST
jgi:hypothetical protein